MIIQFSTGLNSGLESRNVIVISKLISAAGWIRSLVNELELNISFKNIFKTPAKFEEVLFKNDMFIKYVTSILNLTIFFFKKCFFLLKRYFK